MMKIENVTEFNGYLESNEKLNSLFMATSKKYISGASVRANDAKNYSILETHFGIKKEG